MWVAFPGVSGWLEVVHPEVRTAYRPIVAYLVMYLVSSPAMLVHQGVKVAPPVMVHMGDGAMLLERGFSD